MMFCWCALVLFTLVPVVTGNHAGVKIKLTQNGLNYVADNAIKKMIKLYKFPDKNILCNKFTGMQIQRWDKLDSVLTFDPTTGVTITINSANLHVTGNWKIRRTDPFELTLSTLDISATAAVKTDETGNLTLSIETCEVRMGAFIGNSGWDRALQTCLNLYPRTTAGETMCSMMKNTIADYNTQLATLKAKVSEYSGIGFSMGPTVIYNDSIEFSLKDIFRMGQPEETHLSPTNFALPSENTQMFYIGISAFTIQSFVAAYQESDFLSNIITNDMGYLLIGTNVQFRENTSPGHN